MPPRLIKSTLHKRVPTYNLQLFPLHRFKQLHKLLSFPQTIVQGHSEIDILPKNIQNLMEILTLLHCNFNFITLNQTSSSKFFHFVPQGFSWSKPLPVCVFLVHWLRPEHLHQHQRWQCWVWLGGPRSDVQLLDHELLNSTAQFH
jgi:hypothetical protein